MGTQLTRPSTFLLLLSLGSAALLWSRWRRGARLIIVISLILLTLPGLLPLSELLMAPLENAYPPARLPPTITGILVLGGPELPRTSVARGQVTFKDAGKRLLVGLELAQRYPRATFAFSGITGTIYGGGSAHAFVAKELFRSFGITPERLIVEARARNTEENVRFSQALLEPKASDTWVVVTSAMHMPRTLGLFDKAGWNVLPYATDYQSSGQLRWAPTLRFAEQLFAFDNVVHEWLGLFSYRLLGRTNALFPAI